MNEDTPKPYGEFEEEVPKGPVIRRGAQSGVPLKAAIIGGGKACDDLLSLLSHDSLSRLNMEVSCPRL